MTIIDYDADGRILSVIRYGLPDDPISEIYPGRLVLPPGVVVSDVTDYLVNGKVHPRPKHPAKLDGKLLSGMGSSAVVEIEGVQYACDGSPIELGFRYPGKYLVRLKEWPYLDKEFSVEDIA